MFGFGSNICFGYVQVSGFAFDFNALRIQDYSILTPRQYVYDAFCSISSASSRNILVRRSHRDYHNLGGLPQAPVGSIFRLALLFLLLVTIYRGRYYLSMSARVSIT